MDPRYRLINLYALMEIARMCDQVHVVQVISEKSLEVEADLETMRALLS